MSATRSSKQPETVTDQIEDVKFEVEAILKTIQQCLTAIQERLDRLT